MSDIGPKGDNRGGQEGGSPEFAVKSNQAQLIVTREGV